MFELLTLEEWDTIMHAVVDATDQFHGPTRDNTPGFSFLFLIYIITGAFFILNLFVGVIVSAYNEAKAEAARRRRAERREKQRAREREVEQMRLASLRMQNTAEARLEAAVLVMQRCRKEANRRKEERREKEAAEDAAWEVEAKLRANAARTCARRRRSGTHY